MLSPIRLSSVCDTVCRLSVTLVHPTQAVETFGNISTAFGTLAIHGKFYGDSPMGTPPSGELNTTGVAKRRFWTDRRLYFGKRCKIGGKLVLITNRKSHMSFRFGTKIGDLE